MQPFAADSRVSHRKSSPGYCSVRVTGLKESKHYPENREHLFLLVAASFHRKCPRLCLHIHYSLKIKVINKEKEVTILRERRAWAKLEGGRDVYILIKYYLNKELHGPQERSCNTRSFPRNVPGFAGWPASWSDFPLLLYLPLRTFQSHPHSFLCLPCNLGTLLKLGKLLEDSLPTLNSAWALYYSWTNTEDFKWHPQLHNMYYVVWLYSPHYTLILPRWILLSIQLVGVLFSQYTEY